MVKACESARTEWKTCFLSPTYVIFPKFWPSSTEGPRIPEKGPKKGGKKCVLVWTNGEGVCRFWPTGIGNLLTPLPHPKNPIRPRLIEKQKTPFFRVFRPLFPGFRTLFGRFPSSQNQRFYKIDDNDPRLRRFFVNFLYRKFCLSLKSFFSWKYTILIWFIFLENITFVGAGWIWLEGDLSYSHVSCRIHATNPLPTRDLQ